MVTEVVQIFIMPTPCLRAYLTESFHILQKYNPWSDNVPSTFSLQKGQDHKDHSKFLSVLGLCAYITSSTGWQNDPTQKLLQGDRLPQNEEGLQLS